MMAPMGKFNDELQAAGILCAADGLTPSSRGKRIAFDGPTAPSATAHSRSPVNWSLAFWLWEVKDMDEAIIWAKRCPNPMPQAGEIEIRPLV